MFNKKIINHIALTVLVIVIFFQLLTHNNKNSENETQQNIDKQDSMENNIIDIKNRPNNTLNVLNKELHNLINKNRSITKVDN